MCGFNCDSCPILRLEDFLTDDIMALLIIINKNVIGIYTKKTFESLFIELLGCANKESRDILSNVPNVM